MSNKEIAIEIFAQLEKNHINLYHDISKKDFNVELKKFLKIANDLDDIHFDAEMSKLFSLFKDAHTIYSVPDKYIEKCIKFIDNKFYYFDVNAGVCEEIVKVNGVDFEYVYSKLKQMVAYEFDTWANSQIALNLRGIKHLQMIDCNNKKDINKIEYTLKSGKIIVKEYKQKKSTPKPLYSFEILQNDILKIDYRSCKNMEKYPFAQFLEEVKSACRKLPKACLVDVRNNQGGSDEIIQPLLTWLKQNKIKTYVLMNEGVFSGGTFALLDMKKKLNATLVGTEAGQGAHAYGNGGWIEVEGKYFRYCNVYFNRTTIDTNQKVETYPIDKVVDYLGPIHPDIYLEEKVEDVKLGIDGQLRDTLKIIEKDLIKNNNIHNKSF